jgi:hypothetical protein
MGGNLWTFILERDDFFIVDVLEMAPKKNIMEFVVFGKSLEGQCVNAGP